MKQGQGTCGTFKVINLTYLHVLGAGMVYITVHALICAVFENSQRQTLALELDRKITPTNINLWT